MAATMQYNEFADAMVSRDGLDAPPGFAALPPLGLAPPPGLEDVMPVVPTQLTLPPLDEFVVQISNLHKAILSGPMLEATFQQARLEHYVSSVTSKPGKHSGEALVKFADRDAAQRCAWHFNGRAWGGITVTAWVLPSAQAPSKILSANAAVFVPAFLSAAAPEFVPMKVEVACGSDASTQDSIPIGSDVSTQDEESMSEDDKDSTSA